MNALVEEMDMAEDCNVIACGGSCVSAAQAGAITTMSGTPLHL